MKWQGYNEKVADRVNGVVFKMLHNRSVFMLISLAAVILVAVAGEKWGG